jgi:hypothetical protein
VKSLQPWVIAVLLPLLVVMSLSGYATGAGCYAWTMNCFSITVAHDWLSSFVLFGARLLPFLIPAGIAVGLGGLWAIWRLGLRGVRLWLVFAPPIRMLALHASCVVFAPWVLVERRITPDLALDLRVLAVGYLYSALVWLLLDRLGLFAPRLSPWQQREISSSTQA